MFAVALPAPAEAGLAVCNRTLDVANVAIAQGEAGRLVSRGWWVVAPNRCADVVHGPLPSRYVYLHATDVRGRSLLPGTARLCVGTGAFEAEARADCAPAGLVAAPFSEIDTGDARDWTLFLAEPAR